MRLLILVFVVAFLTSAIAEDTKDVKSQNLLSLDELRTLHEMMKNAGDTKEAKEEALKTFIATLPHDKQEPFIKQLSQKINEFNEMILTLRKLLSKVLTKQQLNSLELMVADMYSKHARLTEILATVDEQLKEAVGNEKAKEVMQQVVESFKIKNPENKSIGFFEKVKNFFTSLFH